MTDAEVSGYRRDGVACLRGAFSADWIDLLRIGVERDLAEPGPLAKHYTSADAAGSFFGDYCNWQRIPEYRRFLLESPAAALAGRLMGSRQVNLFHEHVLVKEPGTAEETPWHHDQPYWPVDGDQICSLWIPLDPVPRAVSPEFVAGSHRWGTWYTPRRFVDSGNHPAADPSFQPVPDIAGHRAEYDLRAYDLEPGDCIAFHALTLHGAPGNLSPHRRRAFAARWAGDDVRYVLRPGFMSPPPQPGAPRPGGPLDSDLYPVVWRVEL